MKAIAGTIVVLAAMMFAPLVSAGVLDLDCTASKAVKSAVTRQNNNY